MPNASRTEHRLPSEVEVLRKQVQMSAKLIAKLESRPDLVAPPSTEKPGMITHVFDLQGQVEKKNVEGETHLSEDVASRQ
jgi:hypothetical protein